MNLNPNLYMHESDKAALAALKAIPGFSSLLKGFMNIWNERFSRLENLSSSIHITEKQMPQYYNMLPPICEKLGIEVPDLFLKLDVNPNAYTYGDTHPYIVITSGLLETVPEELIPTILAHECGHIACKHVLYGTMGRMLLTGILSTTKIAALISTPLQMAFAYWMRCSEFSADRAAIICDGSPDKMIEVCMRFAGYDKDILADASTEAFMEQAIEYNEMVKNSKVDKTFEFLRFSYNSHPLTAVRAYECNEWSKTDLYDKIVRYTHGESSILDDPEIQTKEIPLNYSYKHFLGKSYEEAETILLTAGFSNFSVEKTSDKGVFTKPGQIVKIQINGNDSFSKESWFPFDAEIILFYYEPEEQINTFPVSDDLDIAPMPDFSTKMIGRDYQDLTKQLLQIGFTNIRSEYIIVKKRAFTKENTVTNIQINGKNSFNKGDWFKKDSLIIITYQTFIN